MANKNALDTHPRPWRQDPPAVPRDAANSAGPAPCGACGGIFMAKCRGELAVPLAMKCHEMP